MNKSLTPEIFPWDYLSDSGRLPKMPYFYRIIILKNKRQIFLFNYWGVSFENM